MRLKTLDLFNGAGGSSIGAQMAGAKIVAGIDMWQVASNAYKNYFSEAKVLCRDIKTVYPRKLKEQIGDIDIVIASPECTNHSCAKGAGVRCEESKKTAFQVIRFAKVFQPKWIVIENVVQMKSWSRHAELLEQLWELGYYVKEEKLNAKNFGVPQSRRRLYLLCSLTGKAELIEPKKNHIRTAGTVINKKEDYKFSPLFSDCRAVATKARAERAIEKLGNKEPFILVYYGSDGSGGWQSLDRPLRTITTLDRFAYVKPTANGHMMRMLQPDELKTAMGFPADYPLINGTRRDKVKLMGNAVCPPVMKHIVQSLLSN